jgi:flagellar basal body-associated protein FliL
VVNESKRPDNLDDEETKTESTEVQKSRFAFLSHQAVKYWLAVLLVSTLVIHAIGLAYYRQTIIHSSAILSPEIAMGNFRFAADKTSGGPVASAEFSLYVTALDGMDRLTRSQLASHQFRVQEEIETMLRQAHSGDFADPALNDLKRQIREQVNQVLGSRVISDVIVTNLKIVASDKKEATSSAETSDSAPWLDKTSSYVSRQGENK